MLRTFPQHGPSWMEVCCQAGTLSAISVSTNVQAGVGKHACSHASAGRASAAEQSRSCWLPAHVLLFSGSVRHDHLGNSLPQLPALLAYLSTAPMIAVFHGQVMGWMEQCAYIAASRVGRGGHLLTGSMDSIAFIRSTRIGDIIYISSMVCCFSRWQMLPYEDTALSMTSFTL